MQEEKKKKTLNVWSKNLRTGIIIGETNLLDLMANKICKEVAPASGSGGGGLSIGKKRGSA